MAHKNPLRKDKTCLNCNHVVDNRFCPNCGQENIETRKTFHHLFLHFFEDLTHYENAFWKTIKNLFLRPASLTTEYLSGKRMSYLAPVRLYIFISFVTFFVITVFGTDKLISEKVNKQKEESKKEHFSSKKESDTIYPEQQKIIDLEKKGELSKKESDSIQKMILEIKKSNEEKKGLMTFKDVNSLKELDSVKKVNPNKFNSLEYWFMKKVFQIKEKNTAEEIKEKLKESFMHNLPKLIIIYMPFFAFFLWMFHNKKKWFYFDHGIFTLHYFSFLLLCLLLLFLSKKLLFAFGENSFVNIIYKIIKFGGIIWILYYFFPAHHRFYGGKRWKSALLGTLLFFINSIIIIFFLLAGFIYSLLTIH